MNDYTILHPTTSTVVPCHLCRRTAMAMLVAAAQSDGSEERGLCQEHAEAFWESQTLALATQDLTARPAGAQARFEVDLLVFSPWFTHQLLVLREADGGRALPLMLGLPEAYGLYYVLMGQNHPRPLTFHAWLKSIEALGGEPVEVVVHDVVNGTYIAALRIRQGNRLIELDGRPSDLVPLARLRRLPILIVERVVQQSLMELATSFRQALTSG